MDVGGEQTEQPIAKAMREQREVARLARVGRVAELEGAQVALALQGIDLRMEMSLCIEPMDRLRRNVAARCLGMERFGVGDEIRKRGNGVEYQDDDAADHGQLVLSEAPPDELALRGDRDAGFRFGDQRWRGCVERSGTHRNCPARMRGSIHISSRSDSRVPMTVRKPSSRMIVEPSSMSCEISECSSNGPTVGRLRTTDMMMLPDTV